MARGVNKAIIIGHVGADPEVKYMPSGGAVVNLRVATTESWKDKQTGEKKENTEWHRITFYNRLAEIVGEYIKKGSQIYVEGKLKTRSYEKEGQTHYSTEIIAENMQMLGRKEGGSAPRSESADRGGALRSAPPASGGGGGDGEFGGGGGGGGDFQDDDIPFITKRGMF